MLAARAGAQFAVGADQVERDNLVDNRLQRQPAAVRVARKRPGDAQTIRPGLLLKDPPLPRTPFLYAIQIIDQGRPLNAAFERDDAAPVVEREHLVQIAGVDENRAFGELLAAHGVTAAGDRHRLAGRGRAGDGRLQIGNRRGLDDPRDARRIEL